MLVDMSVPKSTGNRGILQAALTGVVLRQHTINATALCFIVALPPSDVPGSRFRFGSRLGVGRIGSLLKSQAKLFRFFGQGFHGSTTAQELSGFLQRCALPDVIL